MAQRRLSQPEPVEPPLRPRLADSAVALRSPGTRSGVGVQAAEVKGFAA